MIVPLALFYLVWWMLFGQQGCLSVAGLESIYNKSFLFTEYLPKVICVASDVSFWTYVRKTINPNCFQMIFNYLVVYCIEKIPSKFKFPSPFMPASFSYILKARIALFKKLELQTKACPCLFICFSVLALLS